jgi:hypothetical protein
MGGRPCSSCCSIRARLLHHCLQECSKVVAAPPLAHNLRSTVETKPSLAAMIQYVGHWHHIIAAVIERERAAG